MVNIKMNIVKNGEFIKRDIFTEKNPDWFNQIMGRDESFPFNTFPKHYGISPMLPTEITMEGLRKEGYYNFFFINVERYVTWYERYKPQVHAGWVTSYMKWLIETKHYIPNLKEELVPAFPQDSHSCDMKFIEYIDEDDCFKWLYDYVLDNHIPFDADIVYWFNC